VFLRILIDGIVMQITISSRTLEGAADLIDRYGQSPHQIARRIGLDPAALYRSDLEITGRQCSSLLEEASLLCEERFFGAKLAQLQYSNKTSPYWQFISSGQTLGEVLQYLADNMEQLYSQANSATLIKQKNGVSLCFETRRLNPEPPVHDSLIQSVELGMATLIYEQRLLLGDQWRPAYVQFRHKKPEATSTLKTIFGDKLYYDQDVNAFFLSNDALNASITAPETSKRNASNAALNYKPDSNSQFVIKANRLIFELFNAGNCTVNSLAETLGMSRRSLQLRLQKNQTSYRQLYDAVRFEMAKQYLLHSSLPHYAIAERLNFTDAPAFSKFIKEHSGLSPRNYKRARS